MRYLLLFALFVSLAPAEGKLAGGPYVINVGPKQATVAWIVQSSDVKLGTAPGNLSKAAPVLRMEKVNYTNLTPGTTYYYDVMGQDAGRGSFRTPAPDGAAFTFVVYGDTRSRHELHRKVAEAVAAADPEFVVHTGDLVADGNDTALWPVFFSIEKELLNKTAFFPVLGNHERNNPQYYEFFDVRKPYYSWDWGSVHLVVLNTDLGNLADVKEAKERFWAEQRTWLEADLRKTKKPLKMLVFHHPPFTAMAKRQDDNPEVRALVPLFEQYKVTAVFTGHDHNYQHHERNGIHYVVTGGGGAPLYPLDAPMAGLTKKIESTEHYVRIRVEGAKAKVEAVALDGHLIDTIELQ